MASGDGEIKSKCRPKNPCILIRKLVNLIEHPVSKHAVERHLQVLGDFLNASYYAFWLHDISFIIRLYEHLVRQIEKTPQFKGPLECLLHLSAVPPMTTKVSDKLVYARDLQEYFSVLGYLIACLHDEHLQKLAVQAIRELLDPQCPVGYCCVPLDFCKEAADKSRLPEILGQLLQIVSDKLYPELLNVTYLVCQLSTASCQRMVNENAIEYLLQRLEPTWRDRDIETKPKEPNFKDTIPGLDDTCSILWLLLNSIDKNKMNVKNPSLFALWSLHYALKWTFNAPEQKFNRNNLTSILLKILVTFPITDYSESDVCYDIVCLAATTVGCKCHWPLVIREDKWDFQFKKIILACLHFSKSCAEIYENGILRVLMKNFFEASPKDKNQIEQFCELSIIMLKLVPKQLSNSTDTFLLYEGPNKLLQLIDSYLLEKFDNEMLLAAMYCLHHTLKNPVIITTVENSKAVDIIISLTKRLLEEETLTMTYQKILAHVFCILQILYSAEHPDNNESIHLSLSYLNRVIHPKETDTLIDIRVTMCAIHLLWTCILLNKYWYRKFLKEGGVYTLLDTLEVSIFPVKVLLLGVLADISKKSSSIPYLITWRKRGHRLLGTLLEIFRNKTNAICGRKEIEKNDYELNEWLELCQNQKVYFKSDCVSKKVLLEKCRCRIFGILYSVKVRFKEKVQLANDRYKLFPEELNTNNELTLLFANNYLSLRICDSWMQIFKEMRKENVVPVDEDFDQLSETISLIRGWKIHLQKIIETIIKKEQHENYCEEMKTYITLKDARLSDALDALKECRFIANCTEKMFQMRKKFMFQSQIDLVIAKSGSFHKTINELPFTNIFNQTISIQSNVVYGRKKEQSSVVLISPDVSEILEFSDDEHELNEPYLSC